MQAEAVICRRVLSAIFLRILCTWLFAVKVAILKILQRKSVLWYNKGHIIHHYPISGPVNQGVIMRFPKRYVRSASIAGVAALFSMALFAGAQAQPQPDRQPMHREMAKAKAERLAALRTAVPAQSAGQADYDVKYYKLHITIDPSTETINGYVTVTGKVLNNLNVVELDLSNTLIVTMVRGGGLVFPFTHVNSILSVTLDRTYITGEAFTFNVYYEGSPDPAYEAFGFDTYGEEPMIWSLSQPYGARSWWPCKDVPSDKADSVDLEIKVPTGLIVASNGTLRGVTSAFGWDTYSWHEGYPIATYLVSVAIHPYTVFSHWYRYSRTDSMEVRYYVFPDNYENVQENYARTVPMIGLFSSLFGQYPFLEEKYGHADFLWYGGMEHQTITSLGVWWSEYLIAHELSHMWWGDMVTCEDFHHIWMNEGFATYSEALWSEHTYGDSVYHQDMAAAKYFGPGTVYVPDPDDWDRIFHTGLSYDKGSWVLHMLRHVVGDETFFGILQTYYADSRYQYATVTTEQFRDLCKDVSGMDLDFFFHEWIYEEYYPSYGYDWTATPNGSLYDVNVTIKQLQSHYIFKMPIDVRITAGGHDHNFVAWDSLATQSFTFTLADEPAGVELDPDEWILCTVEEPLANPTFDRGILLVNGVDFDVYGAEIWTACEDSAFWGGYDISFWDCFEETASGYPANLPAPLGHGRVPSDSLRQFSTVIWIGNNYNGDLTDWYDTSILSYLYAGGNVLLLTRHGQIFVTEPMRQYLGITWNESSPGTLNDCAAAYPGLNDMEHIGEQNSCAVFDTALATAESGILFKETLTFPTRLGLGVWRNPASGGTCRADGARFVFVSGRPYRWNHDQLRANVEFILGELFGEPWSPATGAAENPRPPAFHLGQNYPNPFNPRTMIRFSIPERRTVRLHVYDVAGRLVASLADRAYPAGIHSVTWNGTNRRGEPVASGIYLYRLQAGQDTATRKMILLR